MICSQCESAARALCAFCGRSVCADHIRSKTLYTGFGCIAKQGIFQKGIQAGVVVRDAVWCGTCTVEYERTY